MPREWLGKPWHILIMEYYAADNRMGKISISDFQTYCQVKKKSTKERLDYKERLEISPKRKNKI